MFKTLTALYVEDEDEIRGIVESLLKNLFKEFITATNGQEGLDSFNDNQIDIVITDINMPKMNGIDMCRHIRESDLAVPIVITTAHNDKDFLHKAISVGVTGFVTKPMDMRLLIKTIEKSVEPILLKQKYDDEVKRNTEERIRNAKFTATGQLAAGITHEINTPLTYIKANIEMIHYDVEDINDEQLKSNIEKSMVKIDDGIHRIENIISSMKEMSHQSKQEKADSNIYSSIITSATLAYNKVKHISNVYINGDKFDLDTDKTKLSYIANVQLQRIEQVWIIIINNAMDELMKVDNFLDRRLDIDISQTDTHVIVKFKDNAGGIKEEIIEHIFEPFKGSKDSSGMGVGLSIAKKILEDHNNSDIKAYNEDNGAVFEITLAK